MKNFRKWFTQQFKCEPPGELLGHLKDFPEGSSGSTGSIYGLDDIIAFTEERELDAKGVIYLGAGDLSVYLMKAVDGKVFVVDSKDYKSVDATFKNLDVCKSLLSLD